MHEEPRSGAGGEDEEAHEIVSLLFAVIDQGSRNFEEISTREGLSPVQARTLLYLSEPAPMRAVAEHLRCDPSYVTEIADALEKRALVTRAAAPDDRRVKLLLLTRKGQGARNVIRKAFTSSSPVMANLSSSERRELKWLLSKMATRTAQARGRPERSS